jgi:PAS domain S-box-containing protein
MGRSESAAVLLIERDGDGSSAASAALKEILSTSYRLTLAPDIRTAIEIFRASPADVLLVMASADDPGLTALDALRGHCGDCPIIVLGALDNSPAEECCEARRGVEYLSQGEWRGPALVRAIRRAIARLAEVKQMEEVLAEERNLLRAVIDTIPDQIYVKDIHHRFVLANLATQRFFGATGEALVGKTDGDFFSADAASSFRWEEEQVLRSGRAVMNREERTVSPEGKAQWNLTTKAPLRDKRANVIGLVGINRNITERKRAIEQLQRTNEMLERREQELLRALADLKQSHETLQNTQLQLLQFDKLESVGRLAAGIAHEVKNPLAIISTGIDYLTQVAAERAADDPLNRVVGSMSRAVRRADAVIRGLLDFSAPAALCAELCDLNLVIRQALVLVDHELMRCSVTLITELHENLPRVSADANKLEQVFLNLFMNAIQAMPQGGTLTLRTSVQRLTALGHHVGDNRAERFRAGDWVVVAEVDDTGHGIPDEKLAKVFDPFFTTKPTGKGTGLGLSVARTIVELHGGMLQLYNRAEGGARAQLTLKATGDMTHDDANP